MSDTSQLVTASQLWQDFDPLACPLEYSVVKKVSENGVAFTSVVFTALSAQDGKVRAVVTVAESLTRPNPKPSILYIPDYGKASKKALLEHFANIGYRVFALNYGGAAPGEEFYTKYPPSLSHGEYAKAADRLNTANHGAQGASPFLWAQVARRAITLIQEYPGTQTKTLAVIGNKSGANIAWQVAATDNRVTAFVPSFVAHQPISFDAELPRERQQWYMAQECGVYAKMLKCPVLFVGAANSFYTPIETLPKTFELLPEATKRAYAIAPLMNKKISAEVLSAIDVFVKGALPKPPQISVLGNSVSILVDNPKNVKSAAVLYAVADNQPSFRNWERIPVTPDTKGAAAAAISNHADTSVLAYAEVHYSGGYMLTSLPVEFVPPYPQNAAKNPGKVKKRVNIIYERKMGLAGFIAESDDAPFFMESESVFIAVGPNELKGLTVKDGDLSTYALSDPVFRGHDGDLLRFDAASFEAREANITLHVETEDGEIQVFNAPFTLPGGEWQQFTFDISNFKNAQNVPLKCWSFVKKTTFPDAAGMFFNNILWV